MPRDRSTDVRSGFGRGRGYRTREVCGIANIASGRCKTVKTSRIEGTVRLKLRSKTKSAYRIRVRGGAGGAGGPVGAGPRREGRRAIGGTAKELCVLSEFTRGPAPPLLSRDRSTKEFLGHTSGVIEREAAREAAARAYAVRLRRAPMPCAYPVRSPPKTDPQADGTRWTAGSNPSAPSSASAAPPSPAKTERLAAGQRVRSALRILGPLMRSTRICRAAGSSQ